MPTVSSYGALGLEFRRDEPAAFDDGRTFVVLEKTRDLEWAVIDTRDMRAMKERMPFDEAVEWCKLLNDSEEKNEHL